MPVSEALTKSLTKNIAGRISHLSLGRLKKILLDKNGSDWDSRYSDGLHEQSKSLPL